MTVIAPRVHASPRYTPLLAGIAVFAISTFDIYLILVRSSRVGDAAEALVAAGYQVREAK